MDLILWRHAEAHEPAPGQADMARALTRRGEKQAARMAQWLGCQLPNGARIWSSPARRTEQTAQALDRKYKVSQSLSPQASVEQLLELAQWPHGKACSLLVGHQPTLGQAVAQLLGISSGECAVRKGSVWWLRYSEREEGRQTVVATVQCPEFL